MADVKDILARLDGVKRSGDGKHWTARCPNHDDRHASLWVYEGGGAKCLGPCGTYWPPQEFAELLGIAPPAKSPEVAYDYRDENGELLGQAVRYTKPDGSKGFAQRRPDPLRPGEWVKRKPDRAVLYRLPELLAADHDAWVLFVEGEKDVERVVQDLGLVATTNPEGAGKYRNAFNEWLADRKVVVIPDNDPPDPKRNGKRAGIEHAHDVARRVSTVAREVRYLELPELPDKGDISDWLDMGGTKEELLELIESAPVWSPELDVPPSPPATTSPSQNGHDRSSPELPADDDRFELEPNPSHKVAKLLIQRVLLEHGRLIWADRSRFFYFDGRSKTVAEVGSFDMDVLLENRYGLSAMDPRHKFVIQTLKAQTTEHGEEVEVHQFAHYDHERNVAYLDTGNGQMLRLDGQKIEQVDNGSDGVLFVPTPDSAPWTWQGEQQSSGAFVNTLVTDVNFADDHEWGLSASEQRILFMIWLLSLAFASVQPTKPLTLMRGPEGAGKSFALRRAGMVLLGPSFQVDTPQADGEGDFWTTVTNRPFAAYDNVDQYVRWLEDALNRVATGTRVSKRRLHTTNELTAFTVRCFLAITARTPKFQRMDTASRLLIFSLERVADDARRPEHELLQEVVRRRDELMSDYAALLSLVVATPVPERSAGAMRMADFAHIATRVGLGIGLEEGSIAKIINGLRSAQDLHATKESDLLFLLQELFDKEPAGQQSLEDDGSRTFTTKELWEQLKAIAKNLDLQFRFDKPEKLGIHIEQMRQALSRKFEITGKPHVGQRRLRGWAIRPVAAAGDRVEAHSEAAEMVP